MEGGRPAEGNVITLGVREKNMTTYVGERPRNTRGTKHGEGEYEDHDLSSAIKGATQDVVVLAVPPRMVAAQPELRRQPYENARADGRGYPGVLE